MTAAVQTLHQAKTTAIVQCGFGFGIVFVNPALEALGWDPPRLCGTAFKNAWLNPVCAGGESRCRTHLVGALSDAHPLSPRGVKEALERVNMMPAASGAPGTRVSFGNWTRRAWMGAGYAAPRRLDADGVNSHLVDRFGEE